MTIHNLDIIGVRRYAVPEKTISEERADYIYVATYGNFHLSRAVNGLKQVLEECSQSNCTKILIDIRNLKSLPSEIDRYVFGSMIPIFQKKEAVKIAIVTSPQMVQKEKIAERVAITAGASVKSTANLDEAYAWLGVEDR
jgi:hypothetical protein